MKRIDDTGRTFRETIQNDYFYIDKTEYLYNLINTGNKYFFLSRPRRFGKSLTISTFESIFRGEKELFSNLYLGKTDYDFKKYNVLRFDFSLIPHKNPDEFYEALNDRLYKISLDNNVPIYSKKNGEMFKQIIEGLSKEEQRVVVLVDEYDAPSTDSAFKGKEVTDSICEIMKEFFSVLKGSPECLRFVFITGVTRYAKTGVFSEFNNLDDISLNPEYATMLGFTKGELLEYFREDINKNSKKLNYTQDEYLLKIKNRYDGYRFSLDKNRNSKETETVYNPISICKFFSLGGENFKNYWSDTGGTTLLVNMAKQINFSLLKTNEIKVNFLALSNLDIYSLVHNPDEEKLYYLMYQAGYLTLKEKLDEDRYILDFPNGEVRESFSFSLCDSYIKDKHLNSSILYDTLDFLRSGDFNSAYKNIVSLYASLPYNYYTKNSSEDSVKAPFVWGLRGVVNAQKGESITAEVSSSSGKCDIEILLENHVYLIEVKLDQNPEYALKYIKDKGCYKKYINSDEKREIHLVGINFVLHSSDKGEKRLPEERYAEEIL